MGGVQVLFYCGFFLYTISKPSKECVLFITADCQHGLNKGMTSVDFYEMSTVIVDKIKWTELNAPSKDGLES